MFTLKQLLQSLGSLFAMRSIGPKTPWFSTMLSILPHLEVASSTAFWPRE